MIDLHCHSTFSDGSLTPRELAQLAHTVGLSAIALTDHDSVEGLPQFIDACNDLDIRAIRGVEISLDFPPPGSMHLLGYFFDSQNEALRKSLKAIVNGRTERNRKILKNLQASGIKLGMEDISIFAGSDVVGRPHFAQALIKHGYVRDKEEAFNNWLARGRPAYAERFRLSPRDGIARIREAGGVAVLAHPFTLQLSPTQLRKTISELADYGLGGIEIFYSMHNKRMRAQYSKLARDFDLAMTGGSDFHGDMNPDIQLGRGFGNVIVDDSILPQLETKL